MSFRSAPTNLLFDDDGVWLGMNGIVVGAIGAYCLWSAGRLAEGEWREGFSLSAAHTTASDWCVLVTRDASTYC